MAMFNLFNTNAYKFLILEKELIGSVATTEYDAEGVIKFRDGVVTGGVVTGNGAETFESTATLHIKPNEPFIALLKGNLLGNGVRIEDEAGETEDYKIIGQSIGKDFDTGNVEFYKVTLKRENIVEWDSSSPLE